MTGFKIFKEFLKTKNTEYRLETVWPTMPKIFTLCPFTEKVVDP